MNVQHTPGPWVRDFEDDVLSADGDLVAAVYAGDLDEQEDNARLIAAAPDMLAALELIAASGQRNAAYDACVAAIAKAKGLQL